MSDCKLQKIGSVISTDEPVVVLLTEQMPAPSLASKLEIEGVSHRIISTRRSTAIILSDKLVAPPFAKILETEGKSRDGRRRRDNELTCLQSIKHTTKETSRPYRQTVQRVYTSSIHPGLFHNAMLHRCTNSPKQPKRNTSLFQLSPQTNILPLQAARLPTKLGCFLLALSQFLLQLLDSFSASHGLSDPAKLVVEARV